MVNYLSSPSHNTNTQFSYTQAYRKQNGRFKKGISHYHNHQTLLKLLDFQKEQELVKRYPAAASKKAKIRPVTEGCPASHSPSTSHSASSNFLKNIMRIFVLVCGVSVATASTLQQDNQTLSLGCSSDQNRVNLPIVINSASSASFSVNETKIICQLIERIGLSINQRTKERSYSIIDTVALPNATPAILNQEKEAFLKTGCNDIRESLIPSLTAWFNYTLGDKCCGFFVQGENESSFGNRISQTFLDSFHYSSGNFFYILKQRILNKNLSQEEKQSYKNDMSHIVNLNSNVNKDKYLNGICHYFNHTFPPMPKEDKNWLAYTFSIVGGIFGGTVLLAGTVYGTVKIYLKCRDRHIRKGYLEEI